MMPNNLVASIDEMKMIVPQSIIVIIHCEHQRRNQYSAHGGSHSFNYKVDVSIMHLQLHHIPISCDAASAHAKIAIIVSNNRVNLSHV